MSINKNTAELKFKCSFSTSFNQKLYISGNIEELGNWKPEAAIELLTNSDSFPNWTTNNIIKVPVGAEIKYKYLIKDNSNNIIWEELESDREINITSNESYLILDKEKTNKGQIIKGNPNIYQKFDRRSSQPGVDNNNLFIYDNQLLNGLTEQVFDNIMASNSNDLNNRDRITILSALLPFKIKKVSETEEDFSKKYQIIMTEDNLVYQILYNIKEKNPNVFWVGILRNFMEFNEMELMDISEYLAEKNIFVVQCTEKDFNDYTIYKHKILYPIFIENTIDYENNEFLKNYEQYYFAFQNINKLFCEQLLEFNEKNDLIMINDIGLSFVPYYFMKKNLYARIGIYFHMSFPSSDVFKVIPKSDELINSILLCDVIGFHIFPYARNFLAVVEKNLGLLYEIKKNGFITLNYLGRTIIIHISAVGVEKDTIRELCDNDEFTKHYEEYSKIINNRYCIVSIDNVIEVTKFKIKLEAYNKFLEKNPDLKDKIVLFQVIQNRTESENYKIIGKNIIYQTIKNIKEKFGENVIHVEETNDTDNFFNYKKQLALFKNGNLLIINQKWRGICTSVNEFLIMKENSKNFGIIINESISVSPCIKSIFRVNAYNVDDVEDKIEKVFFSQNFNKDLVSRDMKYLKSCTTFKWINKFFSNLKKNTLNIRDYERIDLGIGFDFRIMKLSRNFHRLSHTDFKERYFKTHHRLFFLDYEGTLQNFKETDNTLLSNMPNENVINLLNFLLDDPKNIVYIVSGKAKINLETWFKSIPKLGLAPEYGLIYKECRNEENTYKKIKEIKNMTWKDAALKIVSDFTKKTEGSRLENKENSIVWNFKDCDPYFGRVTSNILERYLSNIFLNNEIEIVSGRDYIEIKPINDNKGYFIHYILNEEIKKGNVPDLILAIGDDTSDEEMFKFLNFVDKTQIIKNFNTTIKTYSTTVGKKPSCANFYIPEPRELFDIFEDIRNKGVNY